MNNNQERGIKETRELFKSAVDFVNAVRISRQDDGRVTIPGDLTNFVTPLFGLPTAVDGADQIPAELRDLDQLEIQELRDEFGSLIDDPRYVKVFHGFLLAGDGIQEILRGEQAS